MVECGNCKRVLGNSLYTKGDKVVCPICALGEEGKDSKYWVNVGRTWKKEKTTVMVEGKPTEVEQWTAK